MVLKSDSRNSSRDLLTAYTGEAGSESFRAFVVMFPGAHEPGSELFVAMSASAHEPGAELFLAFVVLSASARAGGLRGQRLGRRGRARLARLLRRAGDHARAEPGSRSTPLENPAPGHTDDSYIFEDDPTSIREHGKMNTLTMKRIVREVVLKRGVKIAHDPSSIAVIIVKLERMLSLYGLSVKEGQLYYSEEGIAETNGKWSYFSALVLVLFSSFLSLLSSCF